jgi:hypothetical protein
MGDHPQGDRRREEPDADGERLLQHRVPRVERRHQEHAQQRGAPRLFQIWWCESYGPGEL